MEEVRLIGAFCRGGKLPFGLYVKRYLAASQIFLHCFGA